MPKKEAADKISSPISELSPEAMEEILRNAFQAKMRDCAREINEVCRKHGLRLVTKQIIDLESIPPA